MQPPETISFRPNEQDRRILTAIAKQSHLIAIADMLTQSTKQTVYWTAAIRYALRVVAEQMGDDDG